MTEPRPTEEARGADAPVPSGGEAIVTRPAPGRAASPPGKPGGALPSGVERQIRAQRLVAILRLDGAGNSRTEAVDRATRLCEVLVASGVRAAEITVERPYALESIAGVSQRLGDRVLVGAGTVLDERSVDAVADAGARFCVSPHIGADVVGAARRRGLLPIPGLLTPTEVVRALSLGLGLVKLFPAEPLGPSFLSALRGPFSSIGFMPTGGIGHANASRWLAAGAVALGVGSSLVPPDGSFDGLAERARRLVAIVSAEHRDAPGSVTPDVAGPVAGGA